MSAYLCIGITILLTTASQLLQKLVAVRYATLAQRPRALEFYLREPRFWLAMICLGSAMLTWLVALHSIEVSKAYAFLSISYLLVPIIAIFLFGERMTTRAKLGAMLIFIGILFIGRS